MGYRWVVVGDGDVDEGRGSQGLEGGVRGGGYGGAFSYGGDGMDVENGEAREAWAAASVDEGFTGYRQCMHE